MRQKVRVKIELEYSEPGMKDIEARWVCPLSEYSSTSASWNLIREAMEGLLEGVKL